MTDPWGTPNPPEFQQPQPPAEPGQQFGQQFGPPPYGYPMPGYYPPPKQTNGLALAGAITCFIPVVGLVLSIIGRAKAKALGGAGQTAGTVGIVLSLLFTGGFGYGVYEVLNSTAADPGCLSAESAARALDPTMQADEAALKSANVSGDSSQLANAKAKFLRDFETFSVNLESSEQEATHASVKNRIQAVIADITSFTAQLQKTFNSPGSNATGLVQSAQQMATDGNALDSLCGNGLNG